MVGKTMDIDWLPTEETWMHIVRNIVAPARKKIFRHSLRDWLNAADARTTVDRAIEDLADLLEPAWKIGMEPLERKAFLDWLRGHLTLHKAEQAPLFEACDVLADGSEEGIEL
ncbi:MAG: hypothetical protein ABIU05_01750 [Nitrospirales bacterium]